MTLILALDFGGTKLAAGTVEAGSREWLRRESQLSPKNGDPLNDVEIMRSLINAVLDNRRPDAIGVSFGGPVDAQTGIVRLSHHVPGWENIPFSGFEPFPYLRFASDLYSIQKQFYQSYYQDND